MRLTFKSKRQDVTLEGRKLHNEEFHDLNSSQNIIKGITSPGIPATLTEGSRPFPQSLQANARVHLD